MNFAGVDAEVAVPDATVEFRDPEVVSPEASVDTVVGAVPVVVDFAFPLPEDAVAITFEEAPVEVPEEADETIAAGDVVIEA